METKEDIHLLESLLFDPEMSRNKQFSTFEEKRAKQLHRIAKILKNLHKELQMPEVEHWTETTNDGRICLHLYHPHIGAKRTIYLPKEQFALLNHQRWAELEQSTTHSSKAHQ